MTLPPVQPDEKRKWYGLALRHIRMAVRLLRSGFADGASFHTYHAFECAISAFISAQGYPVPPKGKKPVPVPGRKQPKLVYAAPGGDFEEPSAHKARLIFFERLADKTKPYYQLYAPLSRFMTTDYRNNSLYYEARYDLLPYQRYSLASASQELVTIRQFMREVWNEIR